MSFRLHFLNKRTILPLILSLGVVGFLYTLLLSSPVLAAGELDPAVAKVAPSEKQLANSTATWLHKGAIKVTAKSGKTWVFNYYGDTGSTRLYWIPAADSCSDGSTGNYPGDKRPNAYLSFDLKGNFKTGAYLTKPKRVETRCTSWNGSGTKNVDKIEYAKSLFWLDKPAKAIKIWHNNTDISFQKQDIPGNKSNWLSMYVRSGADHQCPDTIAQKKDGTWVFFPMAPKEGVEKDFPFAARAMSQLYSDLYTGIANDEHFFGNCRVESHEIINVFNIPGASTTLPTTTKNYKYWTPDNSDQKDIDGDFCPSDLPKVINMKKRLDWYNDGIGNSEHKLKADGDKLPDRDIWLSQCKYDEKGTDGDNCVKDWSLDYHLDKTCSVTYTTYDTYPYSLGSTSNYALLYFGEDLGLHQHGSGYDDGYRISNRIPEITKKDLGAASSNTNSSDLSFPEEKDDNDPGKEETKCDVDGVGWIVCPVMTFMAGLNDKALAFLGGTFLNVGPDILNDSDLNAAWSTFRDLANGLFVVIFLIIIYSQMTGAGVSNYGIKRMLPKLIIAAILVNLSLILCKIAVDLSNIIGNSIASFFATSLPTGAGGSNSYEGFGDLSWEKQTAAILIGGAALLAGLALLISLGLASLLALAMIVIILVARKALIILLIAVAPLAFVAYLLPNTESIFKKWWGLFKSLLFLYPIIGVVFGASALAASILAKSSDNLVQLSALGVMAIPLFSVPLLLKGALAGTGALGAKLSGLQDRANKRAIGNIKKGRSGEALTAFSQRRQARSAKRRAGDGLIGRANKRFDRSWAGRRLGGELGQASAISNIDKDWDSNVGMHQGLYKHNSATDEMLIADMKNKKLSEEKRAAAAGILMQRSRGAQNSAIREAVAMAQSGDSAIGGIQKQMAHDMGSRKPMGLGAAALGDMQRGALGTEAGDAGGKDYNYDNEIAKRAVSKVSSAGIPDLDPDDISEIQASVQKGNISGEELAALRAKIKAAYDDPRISTRIDASARSGLNGIMGDSTVRDVATAHDEALVQNQLHDMDRRQ